MNIVQEALELSVRWQTVSEGKMHPLRAQEAFDLALKLYDGVQRADTSLMLQHGVEVAEFVAAHRGGEEALITALLHDTLEDSLQPSYCVESDIMDLFGVSVLQRIRTLTKPRADSSCPVHIAEKELCFQMRLLTAMSLDPVLLLVKTGDMVSNLRSLSALGVVRARRYVGTVYTYLAVVECLSPSLAGSLHLEAERALRNLLCNQNDEHFTHSENHHAAVDGAVPVES